MSYPIILCEDNLVQLQQLNTIIKDYILFHSELFKIVLKTKSPQEVENYLIKFEPKNGIYFLDIDLNNSISGIDLAEIIREKDPQAKIIFVTIHDELAPLTLRRRVEALGFVVKDQNLVDFRAEVMDLLELAQERIDAIKLEHNEVFTFSVGTQIYNIDLDEILFIKPSVIPHRVVLYTKTGQYEFYGKLYQLEEKYSGLLRVNRSCLANVMNAREINLSNRLIFFGDEVSIRFSVGKSKIIKNFIKRG